MYTLRLLARVPAEKRQEFLESLTSLTATDEWGLCRKMLFEDVGDDTLFCWMGDCDSKRDIDAFMQSDTFRALRGAARVLGTLEELRIVEDRTELESSESE